MPTMTDEEDELFMDFVMSFRFPQVYDDHKKQDVWLESMQVMIGCWESYKLASGGCAFKSGK